MSGYLRVIPRDLFNEASLLGCHGRLVIALGETRSHRAIVEQTDDGPFRIEQDQSSGSIGIANVVLAIGGVPHRLERPLNARGRWPLIVTENGDPDFEEVQVFDDEGRLTAGMMALIGADANAGPLEEIVDRGGVAYHAGGRYLITVPLPGNTGEIMAACSTTLKGALDMALLSDGMANDVGDDLARPHMYQDEAIDQLRDWAGNAAMVLIGSASGIVLDGT